MEPTVLGQLKSTALILFVYCAACLCFVFCVLCFVFCVLCFVFCVVFKLCNSYHLIGAMQPHLAVEVDWGTLAKDVKQAPVSIPPVFPGLPSPLFLLSPFPLFPFSPFPRFPNLHHRKITCSIKASTAFPIFLSSLLYYFLFSSFYLLFFSTSSLKFLSGQIIVVFGMLNRNVPPQDNNVALRLSSPSSSSIFILYFLSYLFFFLPLFSFFPLKLPLP
jgi:hypothetical protein